jgi:hypothetical protein
VRARIDDRRPAIAAIAAAISQTWNAGAGSKVTVVASGPLTNVALFVSVYPRLLDAVERIVFMGGGIGVGNRSAVAGESKTRLFLLHFCSCCPIRFAYLTSICGQNTTSCAIVSSFRLFVFCLAQIL